MICRWRSCQAVDAVSYSVQDASGGQPLESCRGDTGVLGLASGNQPPLILG
jgi:hypothetical protein